MQVTWSCYDSGNWEAAMRWTEEREDKEFMRKFGEKASQETSTWKIKRQMGRTMDIFIVVLVRYHTVIVGSNFDAGDDFYFSMDQSSETYSTE